MNIYNHIAKNKRDTLLVIFSFIIFWSFAAYLFSYFLMNAYDESSSIALMIMSFLFTGAASLIAYHKSYDLILTLSHAKQVTHDDNPYLIDLVENMCIASGMPMPKVYIIEDTSMNAFSTGKNPENAYICFTSGIVQELEKRELEGVVAHELAHIQNYDIRLMAIVTVLVGTINLFFDWAARGFLYGRRRERSQGGGLLLVIFIIFMVLSPIIGLLIQLAISRKREYLADASAAMMTRYPKGLADALRKLANDHEILEAANSATAHLYIVSPITSSKIMEGLFATHPPIIDRITRLESM